jgi:hypothetical protein
MQFTSSFDPGQIMRHLDTIERHAEELRAAIPVEFADWQDSDMGRQKPRTKTIDVERPTANFTRASTYIQPTSRYRVKKRRRVIRRLRKKAPERIVKSTRPILRQELIEDFHQRFRNLLDRAF